MLKAAYDVFASKIVIQFHLCSSTSAKPDGVVIAVEQVTFSV